MEEAELNPDEMLLDQNEEGGSPLQISAERSQVDILRKWLLPYIYNFWNTACCIYAMSIQ